MPESYPYYHSLIDQLAGKVITRIVQDGVAMEDAIKEQIHFAELDRQQVIHLCFTLQEYGLTANNDPKNYFYIAGDMGKAFPYVENGYVVYAGKKSNPLAPVFAAVEELKAMGFTNQEITDINPELNNILALIDDIQSKYMDVMQDGMPLAAHAISFRTIKGQAAPEVEAPTPDNLQQIEQNTPVVQPDAGAPTTPAEDMPTDQGGDETFFQDEEAGEGSPAAGGATVTISPSPAELGEKISKAPQWTVENVLSIDKAKAYYQQLKKDLEEIVLNDKITIGEDLMQQYNEQRSSIDEAINKIDDAQKDTKKLEKKEDELETEYEGVPENELPTETQLAGEGGASAPLAGPPPAPAPAAK